MRLGVCCGYGTGLMQVWMKGMCVCLNGFGRIWVCSLNLIEYYTLFNCVVARGGYHMDHLLICFISE